MKAKNSVLILAIILSILVIPAVLSQSNTSTGGSGGGSGGGPPINATNGTDTTPPSVGVSLSPSTGITTSTAVTMTAAAYDFGSFSTLELYVDNVKQNFSACNNATGIGGNGSTLYAAHCSSYPSTYSAGTHYYYATATDAAGNFGRGPLGGMYSFTVSGGAGTTPPTVSAYHSPTSGITDSTTVTIYASAFSNTGTPNLEIYVDGTKVNPSGCAGSGSSAGGSSLSCPYSSTFSAGTHTYYAIAKDASGNTASTGTYTFSVAQLFNTTNTTTTCTDSDNGINYYTAGTATDGTKTYTDYCQDSNNLVEYDCGFINGVNGSSHNGLGGSVYYCQYGCSNGACLTAPAANNTNTTLSQCTDSDGGKDYYVKGTAHDSLGNKIDSCSLQMYNNTDGSQSYQYVNECSGDKCYLTEFFCQEANNGTPTGQFFAYPTQFSCPYGCSNGACVNALPANITNRQVNLGEQFKIGKGETVDINGMSVTLRLVDLSIQCSYGSSQATTTVCTQGATIEMGNTANGMQSFFVSKDRPANDQILGLQINYIDSDGATAALMINKYQYELKTQAYPSTDKYRYLTGEPVRISVNAVGDPVKLSNLELVAVIEKPDGFSERIKMAHASGTAEYYGKNIPSGVSIAQQYNYMTKYGAAYFSIDYPTTALPGSYRISIEASTDVETSPVTVSVIDKAILEKYLILKDIANYKFMSADLNKFDTYESTGTQYTAGYKSPQNAASIMVIDFGSKDEVSKFIESVRATQNINIKEDTLNGNRVYTADSGSQKVYFWPSNNFFVAAMLQSSYNEHLVAGSVQTAKAVAQGQVSTATSTAATTAPTQAVTGRVTATATASGGSGGGSSVACPSVCTPMWKKTQIQCVTTPCDPICVYDSCGSGCGPDGVTTFPTEAACNTSNSTTCPAPPPNTVLCVQGSDPVKKIDSNGCVIGYECKPRACTSDAKICPDGSVVGRTGLNCEFAKCQISIKVPSSFTLIENNSVYVKDRNGMKITLDRLYESVLIADKNAYSKQSADITVFGPGGCGPYADPKCLGAPAYSKHYNIKRNEQIEIEGLTLTFKGIEYSGEMRGSFGIEESKPYCGSGSGNPNCYCNDNEMKVPNSGPACKSDQPCPAVAIITTYSCVPKEITDTKIVAFAYLDKYPSDLGVVKNVKEVSHADLLDAALKVATLRQKFDELETKAESIAKFYKDAGDEENARKFTTVATLLNNASSSVASIESKIRNRIDDPTVVDEIKQDIKDLKTLIRQIVLAVVGESPVQTTTSVIG